MEYVYAALLLNKAGKAVDDASVKKVLEAAGVKADDGRVKALIASLEGVDIEEAIKNAAPIATAPVATTSAEPAEEKKEEKAKPDDSKKKEEAAAGLGALFG